MYKTIVQVKSIKEINTLLFNVTESKVFTKKELEQVQFKHKIKSLGARYLLKKSILDYFGVNQLFYDIEILNDSTGKPCVNLNGVVEKIFKEQNLNNILVSISHSRNYISTLTVIQ